MPEEHEDSNQLKAITAHLVEVGKLLRPQQMPQKRHGGKKRSEGLGEHFTDIADWVSSAMGTPVNIIMWLILVIGWTLLFAIHPALQNASFLPGWFTSQTYNFPLNLITTVAELFIGFLVAAASNRIERRNHQQMQRLDRMETQNHRMEQQTLRMEHEHGQMIAELKELLADLHSHTTCAGHTTIGLEIPPATHHPDLTPLTPFGTSTATATTVNISRPRSHKKGTTTHAE